MAPVPHHRSEVFGSPWKGVYCTHIESSRHYGKHWHAVYGLGLLVQGAQRSASGRGPVEAYAGDLITTNPGEVHDGQPLGTATRRWRMVYIEPEVLRAQGGPDVHAASIDLARPVIQDAELAGGLAALLDRIVRWSTVAGSRSIRSSHRPALPCAAEQLACEESLAQVTALLLQRHASAALRPPDAGTGMQGAAPQSPPREVRQVREWLADALLDPPTLAQMAEGAGLSRYQLLRRFADAYGLPPHAWLQQQRAERSRHLIRHGASLADAAAHSGFADQSHMTRIFARQFGFTPGAWQKATQGWPA
jgi:AraC-like DNA-binding protein